jgi:hypothetical protein
MTEVGYRLIVNEPEMFIGDITSLRDVVIRGNTIRALEYLQLMIDSMGIRWKSSGGRLDLASYALQQRNLTWNDFGSTEDAYDRISDFYSGEGNYDNILLLRETTIY